MNKQHVLPKYSIGCETYWETLLSNFPLTYLSDDAPDEQLKRILKLFIFCLHVSIPIVKSFTFDKDNEIKSAHLVACCNVQKDSLLKKIFIIDKL